MKNVMLDLETLGQGPEAAIVAIGAVFFDLQDGTFGEPFYRVVDLASAMAEGGKVDAATIMWWMGQPEEARAIFNLPAVPIDQALLDFASFLEGTADPRAVQVWGNGSDFDNVILASAYRRSGLEVPWAFWNNRCYRTVKNLNPGRKLIRQGTHHNALDDAVSQAQHLMALLSPLP